MNDRDLLNLIKSNPNQGVRTLIAMHGGAVHTICKNFLYDCSENDIEEAVADTFINFWKRSSSFELNEKYSLKSYVYTIARNVSRDKRRKLKKVDVFSIEEVSLDFQTLASAEKVAERNEIEAILHTCLENLKEPDKSVFLYRYFYGYKISDIADMLDISQKKVENILYHGKGRLRKDLQERGIYHV